MQPPLNVAHDLRSLEVRPMRIEKPAQCLQHGLLRVLDPPLTRQRLKLLVQLVGAFHGDGLHGANHTDGRQRAQGSDAPIITVTSIVTAPTSSCRTRTVLRWPPDRSASRRWAGSAPPGLSPVHQVAAALDPDGFAGFIPNREHKSAKAPRPLFDEEVEVGPILGVGGCWSYCRKTLAHFRRW